MKHDGRDDQALQKKKILVFCDSYLPSVQGGGGLWTVVNLVERFSDRYLFFIVTRNYDSRLDRRPFTIVKTGEWNDVGPASVYYLPPNNVTQAKSARLVRDVGPDCVFLNSTMSGPCVRALAARRRGKMGNVPFVVAPCGELSAGALKSKNLKKKMYLSAARATGLFDNVIWKASTELEADEIRQATSSGSEIMIAADLTPRSILPDYNASEKPAKTTGEVSLIFYSRIVPKKNLHYLLESLRSVDKGHVHIALVGTPEDEAYWRECEQLIATLPANVKVEIAGAVTYGAGLRHLFQSHFLVLPTLGENFGYVFIESLAAGTPVITSDQVPWHDLEEKNAGRRISLNEPDAWRSQIERCIEMDNDEFQQMSAAARRYAVEWLARPELDEATSRVLARAVNGK